MPDPITISANDIKLSELDTKNILKLTGYPTVPIEDLDVTLDDVKEMCVYPALIDYFFYFPLVFEYEGAVTARFSVPFPSEWTIGVCSANLVTDIGLPNTPSISPFVNERNYVAGGLFNQGGWDYEMIEAKILNRMFVQGGVNLFAAKKITVDDQQRTVHGMVNTPGILRIVFGQWSSDVSHVKLSNRNDFYKLCQSYVLELLASTRGSLVMNEDVSWNADTMTTKAAELKTEVMDKWIENARVAIIRG